MTMRRSSWPGSMPSTTCASPSPRPMPSSTRGRRTSPSTRSGSTSRASRMMESSGWRGGRGQAGSRRTSASPDSPYVRAVGRKTLISAVARIRHPGCKVDTMLVLEGEQGKMKSSAHRGALRVGLLLRPALRGDHEGRLVATCAGSGSSSGAELDNLSRPESSAVKKYISRKIDDYRPSYGRRNVRVPRQCVFVGHGQRGRLPQGRDGQSAILARPLHGEHRHRGRPS